MKAIVTSTMMVDGDEYSIDGWVEHHSENDYGADADGNRGVKRTIVTDIIDVGIYDSGANDIYESLDPVYQEKAAEILTETFLEG